MKTKHRFLLILGSALTLILQGCTVTNHPLGKQAPGRTSSSAEMERLIDQPGPIQLETINSADWSVPLSGLLNLKSPAAIEAGLKDRDEPIQIYAHLLKHPKFGNYLVDTGVSRKLVNDPGKEGLNWLIRKVMHIERIKLNKSTAEILQGMDGKLSGVFFTHLHIDHISGMPDIPNDVPLYIGASESTETNLKNMFVQGATDQLLENKRPLQEWHFQPDPQNKFEGVIDIFEDGSVFAISVPGHTPGSTAFLIRTTQGPVLLTGDTCHTRWGWEHTVEPGDFTEDNERNLKNLKSLKDLVARHPQIDVRLGHQR
ncbi:MBL fold metallo-hydrolase [Ferrovum myxofaciens]|uniref:MBL fold metallo-hydrolase n=2 Tax=Ferrovum myxofaciens TaxID=416213 RepID=A0A9E6SXF6_9PROT|nr:MBL fold metallo-hydrolase [Ferrovum myxofaciens]QKE39362.1 MAG: MBL fold metallo-hydrolase [Ferrovum myxofaciens]QWY74630.1 MAG: MBL fold metallo-hydrolase [Ferrovum myxofaciens]QWY77379.1 MAG: MBL fold metallo-hydrolase [Ferrovum myxofaciens]